MFWENINKGEIKMVVEFDKVQLFQENPEPRCPCVLLLDTSSSMAGRPISELNSGLIAFKEALQKDELAMLRVEISIISFGPVRIIQDFITANMFEPPVLEASGLTPMGEAINLALHNINERKKLYVKYGLSYYRPWIFLITDGEPNDEWQSAARRIKEGEEARKVSFFPVGVENADMNILSQISVRQPLKLNGLDFRGMFEWLSNSLSGVAHSNPGDNVPLQIPMGWTDV